MSRPVPYYFDRADTRTKQKLYVSGYRKFAGNSIPLTTGYTNKANSFIYNRGRDVVGAFCLNTIEQHELRYSIVWPRRDWEYILERKSIAEESILEVSATWIDPKLSPKRRLIFYAEMLTETVKQARLMNKEYILVGSIVEKLMPFMGAVLPGSLYDGFCDINNERQWVGLYIARTDGLVLRAANKIIQRFVLGWLRNRFGSNRKGGSPDKPSPTGNSPKPKSIGPKSRFSASKRNHRGSFSQATRKLDSDELYA